MDGVLRWDVRVLRVEWALATGGLGGGQAGWTCQPLLLERSLRVAKRARLTAVASSLKC